MNNAALTSTIPQLRAIFKQEFFRSILRLRNFWVWFLALGPVLIVAGHMIMVVIGRDRANIQEDTTVLAAIFQIYYLRLGIFFGCLGIFTRLFRGDMVERTLHYYFLAPIRREVLVAGKFLAGVATAVVTFGIGVLLCFVFMYYGFGSEGARFVFEGPGLSHLGSYMLVTLLACTGYGALFLLFGMLFRNPIIPAVAIMLWEGLNHFMPAVLKKLSVIFYLEPLCPIELPQRDVGAIFSVAADPLPAYLAIPGLFLVSAAFLAYACWKSREIEINYSTD
jgi:ABC-type transport system involved in multi-copper enzyme maturation permease subunit